MLKDTLPLNIYSGVFDTGHCQGIAVDTAKRVIYYSFTTCLVKTDFEGRLLGTVNGLIGHLGCISFCREDGLVYGSLEFKNDSIGRGILARLGRTDEINNAFYCVTFDGDKICRTGMDACADGIMRAAFLRTVTEDYLYDENGVQHRHGCSGIDGTAIGPMPGAAADSEKYVLIAYGIYGDVKRTDNDEQVIVCYRREDIKATARPLDQNGMHTSGPEPIAKLFAFTGNTEWGIQNLEYDVSTGDYIAAVYCGKKPIFANKPMYIISGADAPKNDRLTVKGVSDFPYGSTGVAALGDGLYYFSEDAGNRAEGWYTNVHLYENNGEGFVRL